MWRVRAGSALARFHICKQATVQWRRTEIIAMPIVQNLCDFCIKPFQFAGFHLVMVPELKATFIVTYRQSFVGVMLGYYASPRGGMLEVGSGEISAELNRALIDALVSGSTYWSHCLSAYSMLFKYPANLNSSTRWLTFIFNGTRDRRHIHGQRPSCVTQAGQYVSWLWLNCIPVNNVVLPGTAYTLGIYR